MAYLASSPSGGWLGVIPVTLRSMLPRFGSWTPPPPNMGSHHGCAVSAGPSPVATGSDSSHQVLLLTRASCKKTRSARARATHPKAPFRCQLSGNTATLRRAVSRVPAAIAAVSTRKTPSPRDTLLSTRASSRGDQPPSGPTSTTGVESEIGPPPGSARATPSSRASDAAPRRRTGSCRSPGGRAGAPASLPPGRSLPIRASRRAAPSRSGRTTVRSASSGHEAVEAELDQLRDGPLGSVCLGPGEPDLERRRRALGSADGSGDLRGRTWAASRRPWRPARARAVAPCLTNEQILHAPAPSAAANGLSRFQTEDLAEVMGVVLGELRRRQDHSTKTITAAARSASSGRRASTLSRRRSGAGRKVPPPVAGPARREAQRACAGARPPPSKA